MIITNLSEFPAIPTRKDLSVDEVPLTALQSTGVGLVSYSLKVGDIVTVWVIGVDVAKKRISLTMKGVQQ